LACPRQVRLGGNLGNAGCPVLPVEIIGSDVIKAPNRASNYVVRAHEL
jgi:hypothetical protein